MIKNIIFDLGNIIIKNPDINTLNYFIKNIEEAKLLKKYIFESSEWKMLDKGLLSNNDAIKRIQERVPRKYFGLIEIIMHKWYELQCINEDTVKIAKELKDNGYKIYVLSNMAKETFEYFKQIDFFELCDGIVISAEEHITKPDKRIFTILLERYNLNPMECLFIDDDDTNKSLDTANEIGILGRRVIPNDSGDIIKLLKEYGIKDLKNQHINEEILEKCLPTYLEKDIKALKEGIKNNVSYVDCLINEVQGSVNSAYTDGDISEEQCDYLYKKYIRMEK